MIFQYLTLNGYQRANIRVSNVEYVEQVIVIVIRCKLGNFLVGLHQPVWVATSDLLYQLIKYACQCVSTYVISL